MANSTSDLRVTHIGEGGHKNHLPVAASTTLYKGTLIAQLTATGMAVAGSTASSGPAVGVATHRATNTGSAGDKRINVEYDRIFCFANGSGGDACSEATLEGSVVYMVDDHTVADNDNSGARQAAGIFRGMEADGTVRVFVSPDILATVAGYLLPA